METRTAQKTRKTLRKNDHAGDRGRHKEEELSMGDEEPREDQVVMQDETTGGGEKTNQAHVRQ